MTADLHKSAVRSTPKDQKVILILRFCGIEQSSAYILDRVYPYAMQQDNYGKFASPIFICLVVVRLEEILKSIALKNAD